MKAQAHHGAAPRLLYLPNEQQEGDQVGPRMAFEQMHALGQLSEYRAFSYLQRAREQGPAAMQQALLDEVTSLRPDWLLWQHVGATAMRDDLVAQMRRIVPTIRLLYHEGDLYGPGKPLPAATRALMGQADVVCLVGHGAFAQQVRRITRAALLFAPHSVDTRRFGQPWPAPQRCEFDVVMIANRVRSRLPWRRIPGADSRQLLARRLGQRLGARLGLFGHGWQGFIGWQGPLAFAEQEAVLRRARLSAGWNHFDGEAGYFSDRLPISLISGVPHVCNWQPGYDEFFGSPPPLRWGRTVDEVVRIVEEVLERPPEALRAIGAAGAAFARAHLTAERVYPRLLAQAQAAAAPPAVAAATAQAAAPATPPAGS